MDYDTLIDQARLRTGLSQRTAAERLMRATVDALGSCLPIVDRERWASRLPHELRVPFRAAEYRGVRTAAQVLGMVPAATGVPQPYAREQAEAVIRLLAQPLEPDERDVLARHLPDELGTLVLEPAAPAIDAPDGSGDDSRPAARPSGSNLATGAPGSSRPIATGEPSTAQSGSVAAWDERRMEHSLGAGRDDEKDTLARGRPGSTRR